MSNKYPGGIITTGADTGYSVGMTSSTMLLPSSTTLTMGTGDFTIETWAFVNDLSNFRGIFQISSASTGFFTTITTSLGIDFKSNGAGFEVYAKGLSNQVTYAVSTNTWYHLALVRSGTTTTFYVNGVSAAAYTADTTSYAGPYLALGNIYDGTSYPFKGYLSNFRIIKGTALYTGTFAPPTQLFNIASTSVLLFNSPTLIDQSVNNFAITVTGDAKVSTFTPFTGFKSGANGFDPTLGSAAPGVWTIDQADAYQSNRQWPIYDPNFNTTTLLMHGDNPANNRDPFYFTDASTSNLNFSVLGCPRASVDTPLTSQNSTEGSVLFNGTDDYLSTTVTSATNPGSGDFTVEAWIKTTNISTLQTVISYGATGARLRVFVNNDSIWVLAGATNITSGSGTVLTANTWYHLAVVRSGSGTNNVKVYINGTQQLQGTNTTDLSAGTNLYVGHEAGASLFSGNMTNLRIVKGVAVYTGNFTVPNSTLKAIQPSGTNISAITSGQTIALILQSPAPTNNKTFVDSSTNNSIITSVGNSAQGTFSPFITNGWSNYFPTSSDYLAPAAGNAVYAPGDTGAWTFETWVYPIASSNFYAVGSTGNYNNVMACAWNGTTFTFTQGNGTGQAVSITASTNYPANNWYHYAVSKDSSNVIRLFVNGVQVGTQTSSSALAAGTRPIINSYWSSSGTATAGGTVYLSNLRWVKGGTLYTTNFTPPTSPLTTNVSSGVCYLLYAQSNQFIDNSQVNNTFVAGGSPTVEAFSPFVPTYTVPSTYSYGFNGATSNLFFSANASPLGVEPFTYEAFIYARGITSSGGTTMRIFDSSNIAMAVYSTGEIIAVPRAGTIVGSNLVLNTWTHVAVVKNTANVVTLYINGNVSGTTLTDTNSYAQANVVIGGANAAPANRTFNGLISNFRLVKGSAVYTANFTPPASSLTAIANTSLLSCQSPSINDNSINNFPLLERGGVTVVSSPTPFDPIVDQTSRSVYSTALVGGSGFFDGSGDYIVSSNVGCPTGNTAFTAEAWYYATGLNSGTSRILDANAFSIGLQTGGQLYGEVKNTTSTVSITGPVIIQKQWNHVALVRTGNAINNANVILYHNGVQVGTKPNERGNVFPGANITIGSLSGGLASTTFKGHISGARILTNNVYYTSNFVPSFAPPTPVTNTSLLLNFTNSGIVDVTGRNTVETAANVQISNAQSKFGGTSLYFNGLEYLTLRNLPVIMPSVTSTSTFTIEFWVYQTQRQTTGVAAILGDMIPTGGSVNWSFGINPSGNLAFYWYNSGAYNCTGGTVPLSTWTHVAVVATSGALSLFINGIRQSLTGTTTLASPSGGTLGYLTIGSWNNGGTGYGFYGYIDELRITKGIRYTGNFTPQTSVWQNQ
jgi:Concanavalin A-like lectin/glucanases superfamily